MIRQLVQMLWGNAISPDLSFCDYKCKIHKRSCYGRRYTSRVEIWVTIPFRDFYMATFFWSHFISTGHNNVVWLHCGNCITFWTSVDTAQNRVSAGILWPLWWFYIVFIVPPLWYHYAELIKTYIFAILVISNLFSPLSFYYSRGRMLSVYSLFVGWNKLGFLHSLR